MAVKLSKIQIQSVLIATLVCGFFAARLVGMSGQISYDYDSYLAIFRSFDLIGDDSSNYFDFPYIYGYKVVPIEFGFFFLYKAINDLTGDAATSYIVIATSSLFLRAYLLARLGVPKLFIILLISISATLFEMNALRLGVSASFLLLGCFFLTRQRTVFALIAYIASLSCHMQAVIFLAPFLTFYFFSEWITASKPRLIFFLLVSTLGSLGISSFLPYVSSEKLQFYLTVGESSSAGITITSFLAASFIAFSIFELPEDSRSGKQIKVWSATVASSSVSVVMLILLTNVAVVGDRAWQLAFAVLAPLYFLFWGKDLNKKSPSFALFTALTLTIAFNVLIRYPISNLFAPVLPGL